MYYNIYPDDTLNGIKFGQDSEGNWGYIAPGADTVNPFKSGTGSWEVDLTITFRLTRSFGPAIDTTGKGVYHITCINGSISSKFKSGTSSMLTDADNGAVVTVSIKSMVWSNYKVL